MNDKSKGLDNILKATEKKLAKESAFDRQLRESLNKQDVSKNYTPEIDPEKLLDVKLLFSSPDSWNYFTKPQGDEYAELLESIYSIGLQQAIVVWEMTVSTYREILQREDKKNLPSELIGKEDNHTIYMVLAGHTRVKAFKEIASMNDEEFSNIKFSKIPARIYSKHSGMNNEIAQQIIIDTNFLSRKLNSVEMSNSILKKYALMGTSIKNKRETIANQLGIIPKQVTRYTNLNKLTKELKDYIVEGKLSVENAQPLCNKSNEVQDFIYDNLEPKDIKKFKRAIIESNSVKELEEVIHNLKEKESKFTVVSNKVEIANERLDEFKAKLEELLKEFK